jgi:cyclase
MLKKRLIFTLLYNQGQFVLSRNFRLQKVGDINWLQKNYDFSKISFSIDELIVLDVSRGERDLKQFSSVLAELSQGCFVPIAAGGGIACLEDARRLLRAGADKVVVNSALYEQVGVVESVAREFGQQCVVASVDAKRSADSSWQVFSQNGSKAMPGAARQWLNQVLGLPIGELYLNSMDRDGTGQGLDMALLAELPSNVTKPVILAGGIGNASHLARGLEQKQVDAVATAHLFNFVGDGLSRARKAVVDADITLAHWDMSLLPALRQVGAS